MERPDFHQCQSCPCRHGCIQTPECESLVRRFLDGDQAAGDDLATRFQPRLSAFLRRKFRAQNPERCDDAIQETWLSVFGIGKNGRSRLVDWLTRADRGPFCLWLIVVVTRKMIDLIRGQRRPAESLHNGDM